MVRRCVWSRNLKNEEAMTRVGSQRHRKKVALNPDRQQFSRQLTYLTKVDGIFLGSLFWRLCLSVFTTVQEIKFKNHTKQHIKQHIKLQTYSSLTAIWTKYLKHNTPLTFWHRSFTFNSNKSPTWRNNFSVYYPDVCLQLNMFRAFSARPRTQHDCRHDTKVKPEAATAIIELLIMGGKTPETCWAVNRLQDNKLKNCCIRLVIYLICTMMHGLTNLKFYI